MIEGEDAELGYESPVAKCAHNDYDFTELGLSNVICLDCGAWWTDEPFLNAA
jgi:hypothetical protein